MSWNMSITEFIVIFIGGVHMVFTSHLISVHTGTSILILLACGVALIHVLILLRTTDLNEALSYAIVAAVSAFIVHYLNLNGVPLPAKGGVGLSLSSETAQGMVYALVSTSAAGVILSGIYYLRKKR